MTGIDITDRTEINVSIRDGFGSGYDGPNGLVKLNADGNLEAYVIHRQVTSAEISSIVLEDGEIAFTSDTHEIHLGDGVTPGGQLVSDEDYGAELLINGGFDTSLDGWSQTTAGKWNWSDGKAVAIINSGFNNYLYQDVTVEAYTWYVLNYDTDQPLKIRANGIVASYLWGADTISNRPSVIKTGNVTTLRIYFASVNLGATSYVDNVSFRKIAYTENIKRYKGLIVGSPTTDWSYVGSGPKASCNSPGILSDFIKSDEGYFDRLGVNTISSGTSDYVKIDITGPNGKSGALLVSERCYPDQWFPFYDRTLEDQPVVALMMAEGANDGNPGIFASTINGSWHIGINSDYDDTDDGYWLKIGGAVNFVGDVDFDETITFKNDIIIDNENDGTKYIYWGGNPSSTDLIAVFGFIKEDGVNSKLINSITDTDTGSLTWTETYNKIVTDKEASFSLYSAGYTSNPNKITMGYKFDSVNPSLRYGYFDLYLNDVKEFSVDTRTGLNAFGARIDSSGVVWTPKVIFDETEEEYNYIDNQNLVTGDGKDFAFDIAGGLRLNFDRDATGREFVLCDSNNGVDIIVANAGEMTVGVDLIVDGNISGDNLSGTNTGDQDLSNFIEGPSVSLVNHLAVFNSTDGKEVRDEAVDVYWVSDVLNIDTGTSNGSSGFSIKTQDGAESLKIKIDDVSDFVTFSLSDYDVGSTVFKSTINSFENNLKINGTDNSNFVEMKTDSGWSSITGYTADANTAFWEIGVIEDNVIGPSDLSIGTRNNINLHIIRNNISVLDFDSDEIKSATSEFKGTGFYIYGDASGDFGGGLGLGGFTGLRINTTETSEQSNIVVADNSILEINKYGAKLHGELEATGFYLPAEQVGFFGGGYGNGITGVSVNGEDDSEYVYIHLADNTPLRFIHDSTKDYAITGSLNFNFIDNDKILFGTGLDSQLYFDGTNTIFNLGTSVLNIAGVVNINSGLTNRGTINIGIPNTNAFFISNGIDVDDSLCFSIVNENDTANVELEVRATNTVFSVGGVEVWGDIRVGAGHTYKSADGSSGATASVAVAKVGGGTRTLNFKNGLYIDYTDS